MLRLKFSSYVKEHERAEIREALLEGLSESQRILHAHSRVKAFYRVETPSRPLFVKARCFTSWARRLGRTVRETKEAREFRNYLSLKNSDISCPEPICIGHQYRRLLLERSFLVLEFIAEALPLRQLLIRSENAKSPLMEELIAFFVLLRDKGVIHEDLQWDNILVSTGPSGLNLYLLDALHVRLYTGARRGDFPATIAWFVHFLNTGGAPQEVIDGFLERARRSGLEDGRGREWLLKKANSFKTCRSPSMNNPG